MNVIHPKIILVISELNLRQSIGNSEKSRSKGREQLVSWFDLKCKEFEEQYRKYSQDHKKQTNCVSVRKKK